MFDKKEGLMKMIESRCGIKCSECGYRGQCGGSCTTITKPIWADFCPVKSCCEGRRHEHCGQCAEFPCALLTQFAYDIEHGDNGRRIETCKYWAGKACTEVISFDIGNFVQAFVKQNADALKGYFAPDAVIRWHDSNEQFSVEEYIRANCEYPGKWNGEIQRVEKIENGVIIVTKIFSSESSHLVTAFVKLVENRISRLDEYYSDCGEIPEWRKDMKIGKPIV